MQEIDQEQPRSVLDVSVNTPLVFGTHAPFDPRAELCDEEV